jgi:hypothetical protein
MLTKTSQHALFESQIGFLLRESFFKDFVHSFSILVSFAARGAFNEMRMKRASFGV